MRITCKRRDKTYVSYRLKQAWPWWSIGSPAFVCCIVGLAAQGSLLQPTR